MLRQIIGVLIGFAAWTVLWLGANAAGPVIAPDAYDEFGLTADPALLGSILVVSIICSLVAGLTWRAIAGRGASLTGAIVLGVALLAVGVMVQVSVWNDMPLWYHLPFLALLVPATLAGGAILRRTNPGGSVAHA